MSHFSICASREDYTTESKDSNTITGSPYYVKNSLRRFIRNPSHLRSLNISNIEIHYPSKDLIQFSDELVELSEIISDSRLKFLYIELTDLTEKESKIIIPEERLEQLKKVFMNMNRSFQYIRLIQSNESVYRTFCSSFSPEMKLEILSFMGYFDSDMFIYICQHIPEKILSLSFFHTSIFRISDRMTFEGIIPLLEQDTLYEFAFRWGESNSYVMKLYFESDFAYGSVLGALYKTTFMYIFDIGNILPKFVRIILRRNYEVKLESNSFALKRFEMLKALDEKVKRGIGFETGKFM